MIDIVFPLGSTNLIDEWSHLLHRISEVFLQRIGEILVPSSNVVIRPRSPDGSTGFFVKILHEEHSGQSDCILIRERTKIDSPTTLELIRDQIEPVEHPVDVVTEVATVRLIIFVILAIRIASHSDQLFPGVTDSGPNAFNAEQLQLT